MCLMFCLLSREVMGGCSKNSGMEYRPPAQKRQRIPTSRARNTDPSRKKRSLIPTSDASFRPFLPPRSVQGADVGGQNGSRHDCR
jgi:hypothetical protein